MTDLTPDYPASQLAEAYRRQVVELEAALDAERARSGNLIDALEKAEDRLCAIYELAGSGEAREALVEAARDLCNQEADTYPALQKALADVDAGRGGRRLRNLEAVAEAVENFTGELDHSYRCEYRTAAKGWKPGEPPVIECQCGLDDLEAAVRRLDANEDTE